MNLVYAVNIEALEASLELMGKGMAGIFTVMILLICCIKVLIAVTKDK